MPFAKSRRSRRRAIASTEGSHAQPDSGHPGHAAVFLSRPRLITASRLNAQTHIRFASADEGRRVLGSADNFTRALSAFDRSVRRQTEQAVSATDFLEFASQQVLPWSDAEVDNLRQILAPVGTLFFDRTLRFPPVVLLVKTSGHEEGHTPYHRGNAIVLPAGVLQWPRETLHEIIVA
ncbi:MAG: hypothetical protein MZW92_05725 [Comamonadaceae bacterium]|nr:hypothetical protein [Comamonadaceae bacterium]